MPRRIPTYRPPGAPSPEQERARRKRSKAFYCSAAWRKLRAAFVAQNPLCVDCLKANRVTATEHVHHVVDRKVRPDLELDWDNLMALCQACHKAHIADDSEPSPVRRWGGR